MYGWHPNEGFYHSNVYMLNPTDAMSDIIAICSDWKYNEYLPDESIINLVAEYPVLAHNLLRQNDWRRRLANEAEALADTLVIRAAQAPDELHYLMDICDSPVLASTPLGKKVK